MVNTFSFRMTLWFAGLVTATLAGVLLLGGLLLNRQMISGIDLLHDVEAQELADMLGPDGSLSAEEIKDRIEHDADGDAELFLMQVHDKVGRVRFRSENLGPAFLPDLSHREPRWTTEMPGIGHVRISEIPIGPWHIQIASRLGPNERVLRDYARVSGLLLLGGAVVSIGVGWGFSRLTLAPLRVIEQTARRIGGDNLSERIPVPPGRDELTALAQLLNQTFDRIETTFAQVKQFTADASHELKTPLALMRLNAERMRPRLADDAEGSMLLGDLLEEIGRLHQIIEHLLFLSKADSGLLHLERQRLALPGWLEAWSEDARVLAEDRGVHFELVAEAGGEMAGVPSLLRQLLFNGLSNALKFSPRGGRVTLRLERREGRWWWILEDEGPGLPVAQLERIFHRFVRYERQVEGGAAAAPVHGGHGLGLAICRSIVDLHGGQIWAENRTDRSGLRLVVAFPGGESAVESRSG